MQRITVAERRRRLAVRHCLARAPGSDGEQNGPADVARSLVALHATDPATVYLSVRARTVPAATVAGISDSLYQLRELVRMLAMRRTMFVLPAESVPMVQAAATDPIARDQRALLVKLLRQTSEVSEPEAWLSDVERSVLGLLAERGGTATAAELTAAEPRLQTRLTLAAGKAYQATPNVTSRLLFVLAAQGQLIRGQPLGSWLSQQYRWALAEHWLADEADRAGGAGGAMAAGAAGHADGASPGDAAAARAELARKWLASFGPAPLSDLKWWTGWTMAQVRAAVGQIETAEVEVGTGDGSGEIAVLGIVLADDQHPTPDPGPWVALLPALDATVMGWSDRSWFLGPHGPALFDQNGNAGPTVWLNGKIVGGWAQRPDGEVAIRILEDSGAEAKGMIEAEAARVADWLAEVRVIPRFRTPLERELARLAAPGAAPWDPWCRQSATVGPLVHLAPQVLRPY